MERIKEAGRRAVLEKAIVLLLHEGLEPGNRIANGHHCSVCGLDYWKANGEHAPDCDIRATFEGLVELAELSEAELSVLRNRAAMVFSTRRL